MNTFHINASLAKAIHNRQRIDSNTSATLQEFTDALSAEWLENHVAYLWWERDNVEHDAFHCGVKVSWSSVDGLEGLEHAKKLGTLVLVEHRVSSLEPLRDLPLTELNLANGPDLKEISPLATCEKLHTLTLSNTAVSDLTPLAKLPHLRKLNAEQLPLDEPSIKLLANMKSDGVTLRLDPDTLARVDAELTAQMKSSSSSGADDVLDTLLSRDLSMAAQLWKNDPFGHDTSRNSVLHLIMKAPLEQSDESPQQTRLKLCHNILTNAPDADALLLPNLSREMPLTLAIEEKVPDLELITLLADHTTSWEPSGCTMSPLGRALALRSYKNGDAAKVYDEIIACIVKHEDALITPKSFAELCAYASLEEVNRALELGADPDPLFSPQLSSAGTPLHQAVEENRLDIAACLLEAGARPNLGATSGGNYYLALHNARSVEMIDLLVAHGADLERANYFGQYVTDEAPSKMNRASDEERIALLDHLLELGAPLPNHQREMLRMAAKHPVYRERLEALLESQGKILDLNALDAQSSVRPEDLKGLKGEFGLKAAKLPTHFKQLIKLVEKHGLNLEQQDKKPGWRAAIKLLRYLHNHSFKGVDPWTWLRARVDAVLEEHLTARAEKDPVSKMLLNEVPASDNQRMASMLWLMGPEKIDDIGRGALDYIVLGHESNYSNDFVPGLRPHVATAMAMLEAGAKPRFDHEGNHTLSHALSGVLVQLPDDDLFEALGSKDQPLLTLENLFQTWERKSKLDNQEEMQAWRQRHAMELFKTIKPDSPFPFLLEGAFRHMNPESLLELFSIFELRANPECPSRTTKIASRMLALAAERSDLALVDALFELGANPEGHETIDAKKWPLARTHSTDVARRLIEAGADLSSPRARHSPTWLAVEIANKFAHSQHQQALIDLLDFLTSQGVRFDIANNRGSTAKSILTDALDNAKSDDIRANLSALIERA